jgi:hypothetical protein
MKTLNIGVTVAVLAVTSTAYAGGTSVGTGWSNTVGTSASATASRHNNKTEAHGIAISAQSTNKGVTARVDTYTRTDTSKGKGTSASQGYFGATSKSVSVGSLSSSVGKSTGTSKNYSTGNGYVSKDKSKTNGNYIAYSATGKSNKQSLNIEVGSINNTSSSNTTSTFNQTTDYGSTYSSSDFNY